MKTCPLCQKELKHQGALNMHMYHCKMKNGSKTENLKTVKATEEGLLVEACKHEYRFLNLNAPIERIAYGENYKEVCKSCQELR